MLDDRGVPGLLVATTAFRDAAEHQARTLGFDPAIVWVNHPVQNRSPEELEALAAAAMKDVLRHLTSDGGDDPRPQAATRARRLAATREPWKSGGPQARRG